MKKMELIIMKALWACLDSVTAEAIAQAAGEQADDIAAVLEDMAGNGLVAQEEGGYRPLLTASQYCTAQTRQLVDQLYSGDALAFLRDYISTAGPEDRAALEDTIIKGDRLR